MKFYPIDPRYRAAAIWLPAVQPRKISIPTILGISVDMASPGTLEFSLLGKTYRLVPVLESPESKELFIIFADHTNHHGTTNQFTVTRKALYPALRI